MPDYELAESVTVDRPEQLRALADPVRVSILALLLERAATVSELAAATGRPKSTIAHHVKTLVNAELLQVVRTRRVRAIEERFYGRTARTFAVGSIATEDAARLDNDLAVAAAESRPAHAADDLHSTLRYARITPEQAAEFWRRIEVLTQEFVQLPRSGSTMYALAIGVYPTDRPTLPDQSV